MKTIECYTSHKNCNGSSCNHAFEQKANWRELKSVQLLYLAANLRIAASSLRDSISVEYGNEGGMNPYPISGGICENWSRDDKDKVIALVQMENKAINESLVWWKANGRRRHTWLLKKAEILN